MAISCQIEEKPDPGEVAELYKSAGLRRPVEDLKRMQKMLANSNLIICARDEGKLVGIARALTDFSYCCYLSDLAVRADYQKKGVGKELINRVQEEIGPESMLLLLSAPTAHDYYPHIGFEKLDCAWSIPRKV